MSDPPIPRPTARILLVDAADRILLFRCRGARDTAGAGDIAPDTVPSEFWITPGGGVHSGETSAEAAARELREETGHAVPVSEVGPVVARCAGQWSSAGLTFAAEDSFFFVRSREAHVDTAGQEELERSLLVAHRWWTLAELEATSEAVYPLGLARLLRRLLAGDTPTRPVRLLW